MPVVVWGARGTDRENGRGLDRRRDNEGTCTLLYHEPYLEYLE